MKSATEQRPAPVGQQTWPLRLRLRPALELSDEQFFALCQLNRDLRLERDQDGELLLMAPTGGDTGWSNARVLVRLGAWAEREGSGVYFDSSTGFRLPNGVVRSPDAAWMPRTRYEALPAEQREQFVPLCPDFVLELRSPSDALPELQAKMAEYVANGARLGWLIDRAARQVYIYRPNQPVERLDQPEQLAGDPVLPGFVLDLRAV